jgi:hypothetical protein
MHIGLAILQYHVVGPLNASTGYRAEASSTQNALNSVYVLFPTYYFPWRVVTLI